MRIIDSHHHIWRQADLPWLVGPMMPRIFGPYEGIRRDYLVDEYISDLESTSVVGSVYVQANWPPAQFEDEVAWVQRVADEAGWPHAIVGYADCTAPDVTEQLDALSRFPLLRGIRMQLHWHQNEMYRFAARPDLCEDETLIRNVQRLGERGLSFDLQVFESQMSSAVTLVRECPDVVFVLQHAGMPEDLSQAGRARWHSQLSLLAAEPNVVCKLSGFGTFIHKNDPAHVQWVVEEALALFGENRCLFGSNFPIEKLWTSYHELVTAHLDACANLSPQALDAVFYGTAKRVYRMSGI